MSYKIYKISQKVNNNYDTYSDAVVVASNKEEAKRIHPRSEDKDYFNRIYYDDNKKKFMEKRKHSEDEEVWDYDWTNSLEDINVEYIGKAGSNMKKGTICASFHAG